MRLFAGTSNQFITDTIHNQIADKLKNEFFNHFRYYPPLSEVNSWRNSLRAISQVFQYAGLVNQGIILEYQLPLTSKRLDCLICGRDSGYKDNAVIIELKQWGACEEASGEKVITWVAGGKREVLHPSIQVGQYQMYLEDAHEAFHEGANPIALDACAYLHNYNCYPGDVLFAEKFKQTLGRWPIFAANDVDRLKDYLTTKLEQGSGIDVLRRIEESKYRPSKKLMEHVEGVIRGKKEYILLDEQMIVYDKVFSSAKEGFHNKQKTIIIVKGGPGTGKSVIAINLMADLLRQEYNAHYVTGSRAFTETLRQIIGSRGTALFTYSNSYSEAEENAVDVLIVDEAHRLRKKSQNRFTPRNKRRDIPQIGELIKATKVSAFFIDDYQIVRPGEIGSVQYIKEYAGKNDCKIFEYELEAQFRCNGSEAFVNWVNNTLGIRPTANVIWNQHEEFDLRIFNAPEDLEKAIREKVQAGYTGRVMAGFCWEWSNPNPDGTLKNDVAIGNYRRPWNAKPETRKLASGIPKSNLWAYDSNGIYQVGCVYTAQGFEFDYAGVIFGNDLVYDFDKGEWEGIPDNSADTVVKRSRDQFSELVKNTYRVLLSRGMKGCYIYFVDKDSERFFKSRIEYHRSQ
ncbi:MAG: DUF2075 domain-containing protein [Thaumarchaeota archaeon]|nr:DUF2075 domain-containing protein [Nitrososphaerota archaeon]